MQPPLPSSSGETSSSLQVLPKGPIVRVLLVHCCSIEPWVCPCANIELLGKGWIHETREARESRSRQFLYVCSFVSQWAFYHCKHYFYWRLMRVVISDCYYFVYISSYFNILHI
jgi:hypothetical protein